jgi:hypothetical protein
VGFVTCGLKGCGYGLRSRHDCGLRSRHDCGLRSRHDYGLRSRHDYELRSRSFQDETGVSGPNQIQETETELVIATACRERG